MYRFNHARWVAAAKIWCESWSGRMWSQLSCISLRKVGFAFPFLLMKFSESVLKPAKPPGLQTDDWQALSPGGSIPSARAHHTAVWSDVANGFYIFGGHDGASLCLSVATLGNCCEWVGCKAGQLRRRQRPVFVPSRGGIGQYKNLPKHAVWLTLGVFTVIVQGVLDWRWRTDTVVILVLSCFDVFFVVILVLPGVRERPERVLHVIFCSFRLIFRGSFVVRCDDVRCEWCEWREWREWCEWCVCVWKHLETRWHGFDLMTFGMLRWKTINFLQVSDVSWRSRGKEKTYEAPSNEVPHMILGYQQGRLMTYLLCMTTVINKCCGFLLFWFCKMFFWHGKRLSQGPQFPMHFRWLSEKLSMHFRRLSGQLSMQVRWFYPINFRCTSDLLAMASTTWTTTIIRCLSSLGLGITLQLF